MSIKLSNTLINAIFKNKNSLTINNIETLFFLYSKISKYSITNITITNDYLLIELNVDEFCNYIYKSLKTGERIDKKFLHTGNPKVKARNNKEVNKNWLLFEKDKRKVFALEQLNQIRDLILGTESLRLLNKYDDVITTIPLIWDISLDDINYGIIKIYISRKTQNLLNSKTLTFKNKSIIKSFFKAKTFIENNNKIKI